MDKTVVLILLTCVLIAVIILRSQSGYTNTKEIPKIIWTYWNEDTIPPFINKCINNFRRFNPDWDVRIATINDVPDDLRSLQPQYQSDWVRLYKLKDHGGVWLDASIILTESLEWIRKRQQLNQTEGLMFYSVRHTVDKNFPVVENWCIAAVPKSETIKKWFEEYDYARRKHGNNGIAYIEELETRFGKPMKNKLMANIDWPDYLIAYICHQKVLQIDNLSYKLFSWEVDDKGPYIYQYNSGWNSYKTVKKLTEGPAPYTPKIVKLIGADRKFIHDDMKIHPDSIFGKYLE
jgi:hypothetical protein